MQRRKGKGLYLAESGEKACLPFQAKLLDDQKGRIFPPVAGTVWADGLQLEWPLPKKATVAEGILPPYGQTTSKDWHGVLKAWLLSPYQGQL